jgi:hypothetical protein
LASSGVVWATAMVVPIKKHDNKTRVMAIFLVIFRSLFQLITLAQKKPDAPKFFLKYFFSSPPFFQSFA